MVGVCVWEKPSKLNPVTHLKLAGRVAGAGNSHARIDFTLLILPSGEISAAYTE